MSKWRRYEIFLPLRFNDGQAVPEPFLTDVLIELEERFGAVSCETQIIRGLWESEGEVFRDELVRVFVDVADLPRNRQFFRQFKRRLKGKFRQIEIWMTTYPVEVV